ncbi:MAG: hypothetical protein VB855_17195, partial [Pirellulaceae bacterium]
FPGQEPIQGLIALRNINVAHGRAGFEGPPSNYLFSLGGYFSVEREVTVIARMRFQFGRGGNKKVAGSGENIPRLTDAGKVSIPLSDIYASLRDAVVNDRAWIQDFQDDEITISQDFYEVLKAYQRYRRAA